MNSKFPKHLWADEAAIINALITSIFREGLAISVFDGEEFSLKRSTVRADIQKEVMATDMTTFVLRDMEGNKKGWFLLIHGNRCDVISDFSDNETCERIWKRVEPTVDYHAR